MPAPPRPHPDLPSVAPAAALPTIDHRAPEAPARFCASLRDTGFAVLSHHPIAGSLIRQVEREWLAFFDSDARHDPALAFDVATQDGYVPPRQSETAKGSAHKDLKEFFHLYRGGRYPAAVSDAARRYGDAAEALAAELLGWVEAHSPAEVRARYSEPLPQMIEGSRQNLLRILRYPPLRGDEPAGALRAAAHEDINLLTVLPAAREPGLEVLARDGSWLAVPCSRDGAEPLLVINTGDMLQEASGGHYPSTTHRVVNPSGAAARVSRVSMPLFLHPRPEVRLSDRHSAGSYLAERLRELGLKP
ncbi:MAG: 2OG-Fe(II) oxygenase family protein [Leptothrix sp. (in: b-proteobacteria)]